MLKQNWHCSWTSRWVFLMLFPQQVIHLQCQLSEVLQFQPSYHMAWPSLAAEVLSNFCLILLPIPHSRRNFSLCISRGIRLVFAKYCHLVWSSRTSSAKIWSTDRSVLRHHLAFGAYNLDQRQKGICLTFVRGSNNCSLSAYLPICLKRAHAQNVSVRIRESPLTLPFQKCDIRGESIYPPLFSNLHLSDSVSTKEAIFRQKWSGHCFSPQTLTHYWFWLWIRQNFWSYPWICVFSSPYRSVACFLIWVYP